jgi:hypothetical protein
MLGFDLMFFLMSNIWSLVRPLYWSSVLLGSAG